MSSADIVLVRTSGTVRLHCEVLDRDGLCRTCGAQVWWVLTPNERRMPVDPPEDEEDSVVDSHFVTYPDAAHFRKKGR